MERSRQRSFASLDMAEPESDLDLETGTVHVNSTNQLLQPTRLVTSVEEEPPASLHSSMSSLYDRSEHLEDSAALHQDRQDSTDYDPKQAQSHSTQMVTDLPPRVYWTGNPLYHLTWESLGLAISICFLVLGAFVVHLKGQPQTAFSIRIIQATQIAPSLWPILFSGVLGNSVRVFAEWRVERGIELLALEQLMGSLTLASSLVTMFKWSVFKFSSLALVVLWAFNPLGSQASFRCAYLQNLVGHGSEPFQYYNHNLSQQFNMSSFPYVEQEVNALFSAALYDVTSRIQNVDRSTPAAQRAVELLGGQGSAATQAAQDLWGNLRIPVLEDLSSYDPELSEQWLQVPWTDSVQNYASLIGDSVAGIDRGFTGNITFNITSSYQSFNCSPWLKFTDLQEMRNWLFANLGVNHTHILNAGHSGSWFVASSRPGWSTKSDYTYTPPKLVFGSTRMISTRLIGGYDITSGETSIIECSTTTTYVDAQVICLFRGSLGKANCGVEAIRKKLHEVDPPSSSVLNPTGLGETGYEIGSIDPLLSGLMSVLEGVGDGPTLLERYIADPLTVFGNPDVFESRYNVDVSILDVDVFEKRFALLYNTLWKAGWSYRSTAGGDMTYEAPVEWLLNTTSRTTFQLPAVYAINTPWMILYFVSVAIMLFAAVFSLILHQRCQAPPILGFVSTLVRDSKFFDDSQTQGNSAENATKKTKRLGTMKVMIADVKSGKEVGRMAFMPVDKGGRVKKRQWYE